MNFDLQVLLDYTAWQRQRWEVRLGELGDTALETSMGPHGDGRFDNAGDVIRHIFSAEFRYAQRIEREPVSEVPQASGVAELFLLGARSREKFTWAVTRLPEPEWDQAREFRLMDFEVSVTPRKLALHVLMHEIRHWAQISTVLRLEGFAGEWHDLLVSPVLGGEFRRVENAT